MTEEEMTARVKGKKCLVLPWDFPGAEAWEATIGNAYWRRDKHEGNYHWWFQVFDGDGEWRILRDDEIRFENDERTEEEKQAAEELDAKLYTEPSSTDWRHEKVNYTLGYLIDRLAVQLSRYHTEDETGGAQDRRTTLMALRTIITKEFGERAGDYFWEVYDEIQD